MINQNTFLSEWFSECEGNIETRLLPSKKQKFFPVEKTDELIKFVSKHLDQNVYIGCATRNGHSGAKANVLNIPGVWADIDFKDEPKKQADKLLKECPLPPTFIIESGNGYHVYWRFREPTDNVAIVEHINRQIAQFFDSDPAVCDASRVFRLPETFNYKYKPKRPVKIQVSNPDRQYNESDFEEHLPPFKHAANNGRIINRPGWQNEALQPKIPGKRHHAAVKLAGRYIEKGLSDEEILPILERWDGQNKPSIADDYGEKELLKVIQSIRKTDERKDRPESRGGPSMADLRLYMDMNIQPGQTFTSKDVCNGLGAYQRGHKKVVYAYLSRLANEGTIKKDKYMHGGFRRPLEISSYDLGGALQTIESFGVKLPLDLHNLLKIEPNQLAALPGRYDAGKSAFLWHAMALNYQDHKVIHFSSPEWDADSIKKRMDELEIPRPHPNVLCYPMEPGYEDLIPNEHCIVLIDYIRAVKDFSDIDRQFYRIFENLHGAVCFAAIQKHPGIDRPVGGQFAVHAPHHVIVLDKMKSNYICKILKTKSEKDLEGLFRLFGFGEGRKLIPYMKDWKKSEIRWERPKDGKK